MDIDSYIKNLSINEAVNIGSHLKYMLSDLEVSNPSKEMIYYLIEGYEAYSIERCTDPDSYIFKMYKDFRNKFL